MDRLDTLPQKFQKKKKKLKRAVIVECKYRDDVAFIKGWQEHSKRHRSVKDAEKYIEKTKREFGDFINMRIKNDNCN